jgi:hypothetical protein
LKPTTRINCRRPLLRARCERPRCCRAKQRYELTPFHLTKWHPLPLTLGVSDNITQLARISQGLAALRDFGPA